jgi:hypothetical protein
MNTTHIKDTAERLIQCASHLYLVGDVRCCSVEVVIEHFTGVNKYPGWQRVPLIISLSDYLTPQFPKNLRTMSQFSTRFSFL